MHRREETSTEDLQKQKIVEGRCYEGTKSRSTTCMNSGMRCNCYSDVCAKEPTRDRNGIFRDIFEGKVDHAMLVNDTKHMEAT